jgi:hypothetical protein
VSVRLTVSRKLNEFPSRIGVTNSVPRTARAFANNPVEIPARAPGFSRVCRGDAAMPSAVGRLSAPWWWCDGDAVAWTHKEAANWALLCFVSHEDGKPVQLTG